MEYKWNINKLRQILFNSKVIYLSSNDDEIKKDSSLAVFQVETALGFFTDIVHTKYPEMGLNDELIRMKKENNRKKLSEKTNILLELLLNKNREIFSIPKSDSNVSPSKIIDLVKKSYWDKSILLSNIIKGEQLLYTCHNIDVFDEDEGIVIYIHSIKYPLVFVRRNNTYADALSLSHELGHVEQFQRVKSNYNTFINQQGSCLSEISSILAEIRMLTSLKGKIDEKDRLSLVSDYLLFYKQKGSNFLNGNQDYMEYLISGLIATYLFILSKIDSLKYSELMNKYYALAASHSDLEIIKKLNITLEDIDKAFDIYYQTYQKEVDKIQKLI